MELPKGSGAGGAGRSDINIGTKGVLGRRGQSDGEGKRTWASEARMVAPRAAPRSGQRWGAVRTTEVGRTRDALGQVPRVDEASRRVACLLGPWCAQIRLGAVVRG
ncbi:hypothetical protein ZWY2020_041265 [Hordeum vulgare]|nr:hypothetical protein ZWY2020_041265 [Hordeum vulgare]